MKSEKAKKQIEVPTSKCEECGQQKPSFGFTHLTGEEGQSSRHLCSRCFNQWYTQRSGLPELETSEFPPLTLCDSFGKMHTFHFTVRFSTGLGIKAFELIEGAPGGYEFALLEHPETPIREVYDDLVEKIKAGIGVHYLEAPDFGSLSDQLYIKGSAVVGRLEQRNQIPKVVVDGREFSWEEFGRFLSSYEGFQFRMECFDPYDSVDIDPDPKRPDPLWWLDRSENSDPKSERTFQ